MKYPPPEIWHGGPLPQFRANELAQNVTLIQEAVDKCTEGHCKYHGEGSQGITWLVTLSDHRQHILKVMFGVDTQNNFMSTYRSRPTSQRDFATLVYMSNRVTQLEAFGVLVDSTVDHYQVIKAFYVLMPYMGLPFRLAFKGHRNKFVDKKGVFVWKAEDEIIEEYCLSYGVQQM
ncbi:hypothetical protein H0H93_009923 [Arthromyces matolae]|nr:hypothetical protein H0H93_009923 [Arthromyces matolae]